MDLGYVVVGALGGVDLVGDAGAHGIRTLAGLGCVWIVVGLGVDDESGAWGFVAVFVGLGLASWTRRTPLALETRGTGDWRCGSVLRAVDDSQLRCFSSIDSAAVEFPV